MFERKGLNYLDIFHKSSIQKLSQIQYIPQHITHIQYIRGLAHFILVENQQKHLKIELVYL